VNYPWMRKKGRSGKDSVGWDPALYEWRKARLAFNEELVECLVPIKPKVVKADIYSGRHWVTTGNMPKRVMCTTTRWHSYSAVGDRLQRDVTFDDCRGLVEYLNGCGDWKAWL
jgi:hypothetical protein